MGLHLDNAGADSTLGQRHRHLTGGQGLNGVEDLGWHEVAGYFSKPTFGQTYTYLLMNLDTFNGLDEQQQSVLLAQGEALESEIAGVLDEPSEKFPLPESRSETKPSTSTDCG